MRNVVGPSLLGMLNVRVIEKAVPVTEWLTASSRHRSRTRRERVMCEPTGGDVGEIVPENVVGCPVVMTLGLVESEI